MPRHAQAMRDKAMAMAMKRKEEYLGARVPRELKDRVIARADELGISVSLLIRKVLEEVFLGEGEAPARAAVTPVAVTESAAKTFPKVLGWKLLELNQRQPCARCGQDMSAGSEAVMGVTAADDEWVIICKSCKQQLAQSHAQ